MMNAPGLETRRPPTAEQARALEVVGASVALSAGAGCGKTFVLAERFVRAIEGPSPTPLGRIVALTFTNKAARELRDRIRRECRLRLAEGGDPATWRGVLRGLEAARISTFHSFCGNLLRRHAVEAGVDPGFVVLDETIALSIREEALAASIRDGLSLRDPDLIELAVEYGLGAVREGLDELLGNRSVGDLARWAGLGPQEVVAGWTKLWEAEVRPQLLADFRRTMTPCLDLIAANDFPNEKVKARLDELCARAAQLGVEPAGDPRTVLEEVRNAAKVQGLAAKLWPSAEIHEAVKDHFKDIRDASDKLLTLLIPDGPTTLLAANHGLMFARLAARARDYYDRAKRSRGGIDNDDLLVLTRELLEKPSNTARAELAATIDLVLVDEFQDTDPVQSGVLEALAGPGIAAGKLFLVGDFKQSIYRFRGARPELFREYRDRFPDAGRLTLSENFRSVPPLLDFVNALFAESFGKPSEPLRPGGDPGTTGPNPAVDFLWAPAVEESADVSSRRRDEARRLAKYLSLRLGEGWTVRDRKDGRSRPANQGDVAFLFRSLSDSSEYQQALVDEGLDFHVVGGSGFYAQQEVLDLINVLTAVDNPCDGVALAGALRSPFFSISDDGLYWLATASKGSPHEGLDLCEGPILEDLPEVDRPKAARARRLLESWREAKDRLPIASLIDRILAESGYEAALIGEALGDRKRANARKLVRMARRFDDQGGFTLADFVARLRADLRGATKETQAATTDEEGEVIRLMSIHQAKGLEFPIVVLPDLDRKRPNARERVAFDATLGPLVNPVVDPLAADEGDEADSGKSLGWTLYRHRERREDDAEAHRLFYVATTRARDCLILSSATDPTKPPASPAVALLADRFQRTTGRFLGTLPEGWGEPRVAVVPDRTMTDGPRPPSRRPAPRLLEVAEIIRRGSAVPVPPPFPASALPRHVTLDPAEGLPSTVARLDRLTRSILADPRSLEPDRLEPIAAKAARLQNPVSPDRLVDEAIRRIEAWARSTLGREVAGSAEVRRGFPWAIRRSIGDRPVTFEGIGDFLYRRPAGGLGVIVLGDSTARESFERLRLLLSAIAAAELTGTPVEQAWRVTLGRAGKAVAIGLTDPAAIDRLVFEVLSTPGRPVSGP